jgi:hypothetical protein
MDFPNAMNFGCIEQNTLGKRCFARINVGNNTDISGPC